MIATNLDLLSALSQAGAIQAMPTSVPVAQNQRFDAALLQAAKVVKDGSGQGAQTENTLTLKVEQALESLLNQLAQQPEDQIRNWAKQPELLKPAVESLTKTYALDPEESKALASSVPLLTKGLAQALDSIKAPVEKTIEIAAPGMISGPQGGEPGTTVDPARSLKPEAPLAQATAAIEERERSTEIQATLAPALVWAPALVSSRTDSGSNADSQVSLASRPVQAASAAVNPAPVQANANVIVPVQNASSPVVNPAAPQTFAPVQAPVTVAFATLSPQAPAPKVAASNNATPEVAGTAAAPTNPSQAKPVVLVETSTVQPRTQAPESASAPKVSGETPAPRTAEEQLLDFKVANSNTPSPSIKVDSVFTLKGDGSTQGVQQMAPQASVEQPLAMSGQPKVETVQAPLPAQPQARQTLPAGATPTFGIDDAKAQAPAAPVPAADNAAVIPTESAPAQAVAPSVQGTTLSAQAVVPNAQQRPTSESSSTPFKAQAPSNGERSFEPSALENSAGFQALARSNNQEETPPSGLGFGQDTLRQVLNQVAKELGVQEAAFTQVSEALAATGKETSRLLIKLKPATLGEVQVDLSVVDGKLTARLIASTPEVRDAFVRDLPAFKANLETQGIKIDQVSVAVRAGSDFNPQSQGQDQPQSNWFPQNHASGSSFSAPVTQAVWAPSTANDQLFSALA